MIDKIKKKLQEGMELSFEALTKKITIIIDYAEEDKFQKLSEVLDEIILELTTDGGYYVSFDTTTTRVMSGILKQYKYVSLYLKEKEEEVKNA